MSKIKLDAQTALTTTCPPGKRKIDVWDTHIPGFVLEVRASGGKTFALRYHDASGRQRQHKIGGFHEITCAEARKMAQKLRSQVVMGESPAAQKATKRSIGTYGDLAAQHLAHAETYQKSFCSTETNMRVHILPRWGKVRLNDIRKQDVAAWLAEKRASGSSPATVEKIRVVFGRSFELGRQWDIAGISAILVEECIKSGTTGHNDIVTALDRLDYDRQHVRIMLTKSADPDPERHRWMKGKAADYILHAQ